MNKKTHTLAAVALAIITGNSPAHSTDLSLTEQTQAFAICAGRFEALATRQGADHDPQSEISRRLQGNFEMLLDATLPYATDAGLDPGAATHWRVAGWTEMAQLMHLRDGSAGADRVARAEADMARRISSCEGLILPG